jgi:hypothetical protein
MISTGMAMDKQTLLYETKTPASASASASACACARPVSIDLIRIIFY